MLVVNNFDANGQNVVTVVLSANSFTIGYNMKFCFSVSADFPGNHDFHGEFWPHILSFVRICLFCLLPLGWHFTELVTMKRMCNCSNLDSVVGVSFINRTLAKLKFACNILC